MMRNLPLLTGMSPSRHARGKNHLRVPRDFNISQLFMGLGFLGRPPSAPFRQDCALPSGVIGPVDSPPCRWQRPQSYKARDLHGVPARVVAPQVSPISSGGIVLLEVKSRGERRASARRGIGARK